MIVLWTAVNVSAVAEAARWIDHLVQNAPAAQQQSYVRFLSLREEFVCSAGVAFSQCRERIPPVFSSASY